MSEFKIEKNIPIPIAIMGRGRKRKYPFDTMDVGDSFIYDEYSIKAIGRIASACRQYMLSVGGQVQFSTRKTVDGMIRVWRIK